MSKSFCRIEKAAGEKLIIKSSFSKKWLAEFKKRISYQDREWDHEAERWTVEGRHFAALIDLAKAHFSIAVYVEGAISTDIHTGERTEQLQLFGS